MENGHLITKDDLGDNILSSIFVVQNQLIKRFKLISNLEDLAVIYVH